jgi:DNA-cytosine methyltransferase
MTPRVRFAELFAGAGGLSMGLKRAGFECAWHAEIADAPRAILSHRWPDVPLYGDVTTLNGAELVAMHGAVDLLTGGSPCQDLSVAGKRAGLVGSRSSLFYEQMRLWRETGADMCLWENVDGARSSNDGKDFGRILSTFVGGAVTVPRARRRGARLSWPSAGVVSGPAGVAAWRIFDAQFFGVPQRRRRVFVLGTRTGSVDPAEVLSLAESVRGDSSTRRETREGSAADADGRAAIPILEVGKRTGVSTTDIRAGSGIGDDGDPMFTLQATAQHGVIAFGAQNSAAQGASASATCTPTLDKSKVPAVISFDWQKGNDVTNERPSTLNVRVERTDPLRASTVPAVLAFDTMNQSVDTVAHTLRDPHGTFGHDTPDHTLSRRTPRSSEESLRGRSPPRRTRRPNPSPKGPRALRTQGNDLLGQHRHGDRSWSAAAGVQRSSIQERRLRGRVRRGRTSRIHSASGIHTQPF